MSKFKIRTFAGPKYHLKSNPEVKRILKAARKSAKEDGFGYIVYEDEPGSVAYTRSVMYGVYDYQTHDDVIALIVVYDG